MSGQYGQVPGGPSPGGQPGPGQYPGGQYPGGPQSGGQHAPGGDFSAVPAAHQLQVPGQEPPRPPRGGPSTGTWVALGVFAVLAIGGSVTAGVLAGNVSDPTPTAVPTTEDPTTVPTPTSSDVTDAPAPTSPTASAEPTQEPTSDPTTAADAPAIVDGRMSGTGYSAAVPAGYEIAGWGVGNEGQVSNGVSQLSVYIWDAADPRTRCNTEMRVLTILVPGTSAALTDRQVGGKDAPGNELRADDGAFYEMRCVLHDDLIYNITVKSTVEVADQASADFAALLDGWVWE